MMDLQDSPACARTAGLFLSFEGIEGTGKSTQVERLRAWLAERVSPVLVVREPGGTLLSERLRDLLLTGRGLEPVPRAELCLYLAARAQLAETVIRPALSRGQIVLADRYAEASEAYQGGGRGLGLGRVRMLNRWVTGGLRPERVFLLDLDPAEGLARIRRGRQGLDNLESEPLEFHTRVRRAYLRLARSEPGRFSVLDAARPEEEIAAEIRRQVDALLPLRAGGERA